MVKLNKIYTRTGDDGSTALGTGERRIKSDARISAYGTVDEANAAIGIARLHISGEVDEMLGRIQNDLFDLGADLCVPETGEPPQFEPLRVTPGQVERLEAEIDRLNAHLEPLTSFVLPGGTPGAAYLHQARTVVRRAERDMVALRAAGEAVGEAAVRYVNRLSEFLFVAARYVNDKGDRDVLWVPGATRER
ncbi:MAG: cob(I)yrinic acid a,c-diamide adenosyltransferase [Alphaproteobacteria bacterium]